MSERVQLRKIAVMGLFGIFDHSVELRTDERVTILHGPNGVGKTVMLRMIQAFFEGTYEILLETNFRQFLVELSDGRAVLVTRSRIHDSSEHTKQLLNLENITLAGETYQWTRDRIEDQRLASYIDNEIPYITRIAEDRWIDDRDGDTYTIAELIRKFRDQLPEALKPLLTSDPEWLSRFRSSVVVSLVETQRLMNPKHVHEDFRYRPRPHARRSPGSTVKQYSQNLQNRIENALATYAAHSQSLDRSFPQRMLGGGTVTLTTSDLKERMKQLEQKRAQLKTIGLIEDDTSYPFDINTLDSATSTQQAVMTLYVKDTEDKLSVLDGLESKVDLLLGNINRKFQPNKRLRADRKLGLVVRDRKELRIDLDSLSSGEQHELVLIYDLLFRIKPNALVLIDEPELSLHVTWQKAFLKELFEIIEVSNFDVILATHSPFIVGDRVDLMVPLALPSEELRDLEQGSSDRPSL